METFNSVNPSTGDKIRSFEATPIESIPKLLEIAKNSQQIWALKSPQYRADLLKNVKDHILNNIDDIAQLISEENGKPLFESYVNDIFPVLELISQYTKKAPKLLKPKKIHLSLMFHRKSYLHFWPVGVVGIISPWNYPFSIPMGEICLALLAGNAVLFKPSEVTLSIGNKILEIFKKSGLPEGLLQIIVGGPIQGNALVTSKVNKIFFTGSVSTGKKVMKAAAENLTPVVLELGGKDPMIILEDADLDFATSAALWGGFSNSGQACASVERIIVDKKISKNFISLLKEKVEKLRFSKDKSNTDLGVITYNNQKNIYLDQINEFYLNNKSIITGGKIIENKKRLTPTIVFSEEKNNSLKIYNEETFGPIVAISEFETLNEAIELANSSKYGLLASVISKNTSLAEQVAKKLHCGSVLINEVLYTHGLAETPWGGIKDSGFGRVHSDEGFYEFLNSTHIHREKISGLVFKSIWWFPYTEHQFKMFKNAMLVLYKSSLLEKLKAIPQLLSEFIQMLKKEKRL